MQTADIMVRLAPHHVCVCFCMYACMCVFRCMPGHAGWGCTIHNTVFNMLSAPILKTTETYTKYIIKDQLPAGKQYYPFGEVDTRRKGYARNSIILQTPV